MKITRHGHGHFTLGDEYSIELTAAWSWDDLGQRLEMRQKNLGDFEPSSSSRHDYVISMSLDEARAMFDAVCAGLKSKGGRAGF